MSRSRNQSSNAAVLVQFQNVCLGPSNVCIFYLETRAIPHLIRGTKNDSLFKLNLNRNLNKLVRLWLYLDRTFGLHETLAYGHLT